MGDHRPTITAEFEMHGHKAHYDFGRCNWSSDSSPECIADWFREQADIAIRKWRFDVEESMAERQKAETEKAELEQFAKLKAKYEPLNK